MHSLLENYLVEVAVHLSALPTKRRNEELREMRTHLENALIVSRELGQSEDKAAQDIVTQFGAPKELGENVVWAWQRGVVRDRRSFWGAAICTSVMLTCQCLLLGPGFSLLFHALLTWFHLDFHHYLLDHPDRATVIAEALLLCIFGTTGLTIGVLFPKRSVSSISMGLAVFCLGWFVVEGKGGWPPTLLWHLCFDSWVGNAVLCGWAGSRARLTWGKRRRLARV